MVVQHNMQAMNANRMLNITTGAQSKSTEKLSSGYKINRAADDAAGLSISEKMRKQIRGLDQASSNAEDGVSAVQTAEGALTEVHSMLQRMNELAVQAANGTNSESDRQSIQDEIDQLTTEIDRVSETTKFNEIYLLKGNAAGASSTVSVAAHDAGLAGTLTDKGNGVTTFTLDKALEDGDTVTIAGKEYTIGTSGKGSILDKTDLNTSTDGYDTTANLEKEVLSAGDSVTYDGNTYTLVDNISVDDIDWASAEEDDTVTIGEVTYTLVADSTADADMGETDIKLGDVNTLKKKVEDAAAEGLQVTAAGLDSTAGVELTADNFIVSALDKGEVSSALINGDSTAAAVAQAGSGETDTVTLSAGDSITISGETTVATAAEPQSARDVYDAIDALSAGNTVAIGTGENQITYTIVDEDDEADEENYKLTKEMILSKIQDGDTVDVNGAGAKTVIGDVGFSNGSDDVISASTAYKMMAEELQQASSIGTDEEATVTNKGNGSFTIKQGTVEVKDSLSFSLHVGSDADMTNKIIVDIDSMSAAGLGVKGLNVADETGAAATYAIDAISDAIAKVSEQRSALGAVQNRLEHTINNLDNVVENTTSAESRIRDTDMAEEMVEYSKNNILAQAGQSMLAQANQSNQGVLSLLG